MIDYKSIPDDSLVAQAQKKDYQAFEELVKRYEGRIYGHTLRLLGNREDAEDVLQETFLNMFKGLENFRGDSSFSTWIYRIATNNALMRLRKLSHGERELNDELPPPESMKRQALASHILDPKDTLLEKEMLQELNKAVDRLPEKYRTIFLLRDVEEFSTDRTAKVLGISEAAVKSRLHRARLYIRELLLKKYEEKAEIQ
ncbi:MAG: sigma-70 family RNA polymerase sigma factor [Deltaproteobacteria bacterium]|nr:sigma-70 family RNA polymerase sigma factor [Candidatus Zymogenaceae bacterium]